VRHRNDLDAAGWIEWAPVRDRYGRFGNGASIAAGIVREDRAATPVSSTRALGAPPGDGGDGRATPSAHGVPRPEVSSAAPTAVWPRLRARNATCR